MAGMRSNEHGNTTTNWRRLGRSTARRRGWLTLGAGALLVAPTAAWAIPPLPSCDCDFVIEPSEPSADGQTLGVQPGDLVCVRGGSREFLRLYNFVGSEAEPVVITNCEGQVDIDNADRGYGLTGEGMEHVIVTGTGTEGVEYGFRVRASREGPDYSASGVVFNGLSTNYELDHMEVYETGFAGFNLKTEPRCDGSANLGNFVQYDTRLHHNYVHDTRGEGLYLGSTGYGGRDYTCDGQTTTLYPHEHHGFDVHHNVIERTGWDGAQIGVTPVDCYVHHNTIVAVGLENEPVQANGLQIGGASACEIWANRIEDGPTNGIIILDAADTWVHDNVVHDFGTAGIYVNDRDNAAIAGSSYIFTHNTIVGTGEEGLQLFAQQTSGHVGKNNIVVDTAGTAISVGNGVDWDADGNITGAGTDVGFADLAGGDFDLAEDAAARDAGVVLADLATDDLRGVPRDDGMPDVGAYEWTDEPLPGDGDGDGDGDSGTGTGGSGGNDGGDGDGDGDGDGETGASANGNDGDGCACDVTSPRGTPLGLAGLVMLGLVVAPRRRAFRRSDRRVVSTPPSA